MDQKPKGATAERGRSRLLETDTKYRRQLTVMTSVPDLFSVRQMAAATGKAINTIMRDVKALRGQNGKDQAG